MEASDSLLQKKNKIFFVLYLTHPHTLRHTFATNMIAAGMEPKTLSTILGHSNLAQTMDLYVHITDDMKRNELEKAMENLKRKMV